MTMHRFEFVLTAAALTIFGVSGCATKNYVRNQTAPLVEHAGKLNQEAEENNRQINDVNDRAQAGIQHAQNSADTANQNAQSASTAAGTAETAANDAVHRADTLDSVVMGLDSYRQVGNVSVTFAFNKAVLTPADREQLDNFASQLTSDKSFLLEVTGGTDSTGPAQYNYDLSQRRADAVVRYLASKYNIPAHRFYLIGIGKDEYVAPNTTAAGRKENRRVEVQVLTNAPAVSAQSNGMQQPQSSSNAPQPQAGNASQNTAPQSNPGPQQ